MTDNDKADATATRRSHARAGANSIFWRATVLGTLILSLPVLVRLAAASAQSTARCASNHIGVRGPTTNKSNTFFTETVSGCAAGQANYVISGEQRLPVDVKRDEADWHLDSLPRLHSRGPEGWHGLVFPRHVHRRRTESLLEGSCDRGRHRDRDFLGWFALDSPKIDGHHVIQDLLVTPR